MGQSLRASALGGLLLWACAQAPAPEPPSLSPDLVQRGGILFLDPRLSADGARSCATCHPGGASDGRIYRGPVKVEPGDPNGRKAPSLRGLWQTPPYLWDGSLENVRDVILRMLEVEMGGTNLPEADLLAMEAYLLSLTPFDRGRVAADGTPTEPATLSERRGGELFVEAKCSRCHPPPAFTRNMRFDVGTGIKTQPPSLRGVATHAPYGHDGRWATLEETVRYMLAAREVELSERQIFELIRYLRLL